MTLLVSVFMDFAKGSNKYFLWFSQNYFVTVATDIHKQIIDTGYFYSSNYAIVNTYEAFRKSHSICLFVW